MLYWIRRWFPAVLWMAVIFILSHRPADDLEPLLPLLQKWLPGIESLDFGHFIAYFILACFIYWGIGIRYFNIIGKCLVVVCCAVYGLTDEVHQMFVEGRHPDVVDLRNDVIGSILAMLLISLPPVHRMLAHGWNKVFAVPKSTSFLRQDNE